jgi:hypothetical protein
MMQSQSSVRLLRVAKASLRLVKECKAKVQEDVGPLLGQAGL